MGIINIPTPAPSKQDDPTATQLYIKDKSFEKAVAEVRGDLMPEYSDKIELIPVKQFLGIDPTNQDNEKEIMAIQQWANEKGYNREEMFKELRKIEFKLGNIDDKQERVKRIYQYLRLTNQINSLMNKLTVLESNNGR